MESTERQRSESSQFRREGFSVNIPRLRGVASLVALSFCAEVAFAQGTEAIAPHRSVEPKPATSVTSQVLWTTADSLSYGGSRTPLGPVWISPFGEWMPDQRSDNGAARPGALQLGVSRALGMNWTASYSMLVLNDESLRPWSAGWLEQRYSAWGTSINGGARDWRHFLGLQYAPTDQVAFVGGVAKAGGVDGGKGAGLMPSGYEKLRLNAGARWRSGDWGLDGAFSFIPGGPSRFPSDAAYISGGGNSGPTYLFALTLSRQF